MKKPKVLFILISCVCFSMVALRAAEVALAAETVSLLLSVNEPGSNLSMF
ncbi:MAG TPA: hypothetical protein VLO30_06835 [Chthoniobacterales bacterium]|nr:hypothetical protein [Chthoniobacterales bacterium]